MLKEKRCCRECGRAITLNSLYKNKGLCIYCFIVDYPEEYKKRRLQDNKSSAIKRQEKKAAKQLFEEPKNKPFDRDLIFKDAVNEFFICGKWKKK